MSNFPPARGTSHSELMQMHDAAEAETVTLERNPARRQVGGDHYTKHKIQPWDVIKEYGLNYWEGNALKYLLRRKKTATRIEDLQKAIHYIEELIQQEMTS